MRSLVVVLSAAFVVLSTAVARADAVITVGQTSDTPPGQASGVCSLRMAIEKVNGGSNSCAVVGTGSSVIALGQGTYTKTPANGPFFFTKSVILKGSSSGPTVVSGQLSAGGLFIISSSVSSAINVSFRSLWIKNSTDPSFDGACLQLQPSTAGAKHTASFDRVVFEACTGRHGGAIRNDGSSLTFSFSTLRNNRAVHGGAIYTSGPTGTSAYFSVTDLRGNVASDSSVTYGGRGGAIYTKHAVTMWTSTIDDNSAGGEGGGAYATTNLGRLDLNQTTVSANFGFKGGGLYEGAAAAITLRNSTVSGNEAYDSGGGIYGENYVELFSSTIAFNRAFFGLGGGVYMQSASGGRTNACIVAKNASGSGSPVADDYRGAPHGAVTSDEARSLFSTEAGAVGLYKNKLFNDIIDAGIWLAPLALNGGYSMSHAIAQFGKARNADRSNLSWQTSDQRGMPRPRDTYHDIGAYEY